MRIQHNSITLHFKRFQIVFNHITYADVLVVVVVAEAPPIPPSSFNSAAIDAAVSFATAQILLAVLDNQDQPAAAFSLTSFCRLGSFSLLYTEFIPSSRDLPMEEIVLDSLHVIYGNLMAFIWLISVLWWMQYNVHLHLLVITPIAWLLLWLLSISTRRNGRRTHSLRTKTAWTKLLLKTFFCLRTETQLTLDGVFFFDFLSTCQYKTRIQMYTLHHSQTSSLLEGVQ